MNTESYEYYAESFGFLTEAEIDSATFEMDMAEMDSPLFISDEEAEAMEREHLAWLAAR